ncbi:hypothetical protein M409DRAFT_70917 [Zasmidium cellare ATCC 36951]|uniref:3-hydroxyisobutyrate dehydrogenase n=1 Tax=Zasmidium cellare ATCC 36951 TaxID=1080233 RepID=A0A6A6C1A4_ZASCE|nr:uncharacterized protein M409DRAFT_70917 [Zasmidium cellare ATCC 36951]KAF2159602.1 hypothetical protein M409DRAFT_70917 [Zasmidium cellare ATCC 36951]
MADLPKSIGWIGLGLMGNPMIRNLLKKVSEDTQFYIHDVVRESVERLVEEGNGRVHACESSVEVADKSDLIISMLPEGRHVKSVYLDEKSGVLASTSLQNKTLIDCSTIDTASSLAVRDACQSHSNSLTLNFYDAPVSGGVVGAEKGTLTFMLGCSATDPNITFLTTLLSLMGGNIFPCGGASLGLTAKLCNNYCSGLIAIAVSESLNIGIKSGMDPRILANVFHTSTAQSAICDDWCPVPGLTPSAPASNHYAGGFRVELMKKDFALAVDTAERVGAQLALGREGLGVYEGASADERCKGLDSRVVYKFLGGEEEWMSKGGFGEGVEMKKDETKRYIQLGKEAEKEGKKGS